MRFQSIKCSDTLHFSTEAYRAIKFVISLNRTHLPPTTTTTPPRTSPALCARWWHHCTATSVTQRQQLQTNKKDLSYPHCRAQTLAQQQIINTMEISDIYANHWARRSSVGVFITLLDEGALLPVSPHRVSKLLIWARSTSSSSFSGRSSR